MCEKSYKYEFRGGRVTYQEFTLLRRPILMGLIFYLFILYSLTACTEQTRMREHTWMNAASHTDTYTHTHKFRNAHIILLKRTVGTLCWHNRFPAPYPKHYPNTWMPNPKPKHNLILTLTLKSNIDPKKIILFPNSHLQEVSKRRCVDFGPHYEIETKTHTHTRAHTHTPSNKTHCVFSAAALKNVSILFCSYLVNCEVFLKQLCVRLSWYQWNSCTQTTIVQNYDELDM